MLRDYRVQVQATNEQQAQLNFDAVFFGIESFGAPIQITPDSPLISKNPKGLIAFIASLIPVFQNFSDPAALEPYLSEQSAEEYRRLQLDLQMAKEIVRIYRGVQSFELYCGWFTAPQEFLAVLKIVIAEDQYLYSPVLFSFAEGEWKLVFGSPAKALPDIRRGTAICMALDNPRRFQMRYRKALSKEGAIMPAENWRTFF